jgi:hypothetical protein
MLQVDHEDYVNALAKVDQKAKSEWGKRMNDVLLEVEIKMKEKSKTL